MEECKGQKFGRISAFLAVSPRSLLRSLSADLIDRYDFAAFHAQVQLARPRMPESHRIVGERGGARSFRFEAIHGIVQSPRPQNSGDTGTREIERINSSPWGRQRQADAAP